MDRVVHHGDNIGNVIKICGCKKDRKKAKAEDMKKRHKLEKV